MQPNRGAYVLYISIKKNCKIKIGSLGVIEFSAGTYVYIGSAMGLHSTSLNNRISRHVRTAISAIEQKSQDNENTKKMEKKEIRQIKKPKNRWHIDYLLQDPNTSIIKIAIIPSKYKIECEISQIYQEFIINKGNKLIFIPRFGSSDCKICQSHLFKLS